MTTRIALLIGGAIALGSLCSPKEIQAQTPQGWAALPDALLDVQGEDQPILVYVSASWCGLCRRMEQEVFPATQPLLERFVRTELDYSDHETVLDVRGQAQTPFGWARDLGVEAVPAFILMEPEGAVIARLSSYLDVETFSRLLAYAATGAYRHAGFADYLERTRSDENR